MFSPLASHRKKCLADPDTIPLHVLQMTTTEECEVSSKNPHIPKSEKTTYQRWFIPSVALYSFRSAHIFLQRASVQDNAKLWFIDEQSNEWSQKEQATVWRICGLLSSPVLKFVYFFYGKKRPQLMNHISGLYHRLMWLRNKSTEN